MKRFTAVLMLILLLCTGCSMMNKKTVKKDKKDSFDLNKAEETVKNYMNFIILDDYDNAKKILSDKAEGVINISKSDYKIKGYNIDTKIKSGSSGVFKIKAARESMIMPKASLEDYYIEVTKEKSDYKITKIKNEIEKESFVGENGIRIRSDGDVETKLLIDIDGFPEYAYAKTDKIKLNKFSVPKDKFGAISFNYSGNKLAVSTFDGSSVFYGMVRINEAVSTQANGQGTQQQQQGGNGSSGSSSNGFAKEKPIGKELMPLDIIQNAKVQYMTFSPDEKYIAVQCADNKNDTFLNIYDAMSGDILPYESKDKVNASDEDIMFKYFDDKGNAFFDTKEKKGKKILKKWELNMENMKVKEI